VVFNYVCGLSPRRRRLRLRPGDAVLSGTRPRVGPVDHRLALLPRTLGYGGEGGAPALELDEDLPPLRVELTGQRGVVVEHLFDGRPRQHLAEVGQQLAPRL